MNKRLIYFFVILIGLIFIVSACEQVVGRRLNIREGNQCKQGQSRCGTQQECGDQYPCSFVCNEPLPRGGYAYTKYSCELGCSDGRCVTPECVPLIRNHNNLNENRINMIFVGLNYENVNQFKNRILETLNVNGGSPGFFAEAPFANNQNKFNFWYITEIRDYDGTNSWRDTQELFSKCDYLSLNDKQKVIFDVSFFGGYALHGILSIGDASFEGEENDHYLYR